MRPVRRREQFQLTWQATDPTKPLPADLAKPLDVYVPPGQSRVVRAPTLPPGDTAKLVLTGDDDTFDNVLWLVPPTRDRVRILHLASEPADEPQTLRYFLERALGDGDARRAVVVETIDPHAAGIRTPTSADLADVALVVVVHVEVRCRTLGGCTRRLDRTRRPRARRPVDRKRRRLRGVLPESLAKPDAVRVAEGDRSREYCAVERRRPQTSAFLRRSMIRDFPTSRKFAFGGTASFRSIPPRRVSLRSRCVFDSGDPAFVEIPRRRPRRTYCKRLASSRKPARRIEQVRPVGQYAHRAGA
ncbi:MAG: hypothetical protein QM775_08495 [Pirellulales bacterium]